MNINIHTTYNLVLATDPVPARKDGYWVSAHIGFIENIEFIGSRKNITKYRLYWGASFLLFLLFVFGRFWDSPSNKNEDIAAQNDRIGFIDLYRGYRGVNLSKFIGTPQKTDINILSARKEKGVHSGPKGLK